jgi:hypothetical protein
LETELKPIVMSPPNLAMRLLDLAGLNIPGASYEFCGGRELVYRLPLSPSEASRVYICELHVPPGKDSPRMIVVEPDLRVLAGGRKLPHIYPFDGRGVYLCLWKPKYKEWDWSMRLSETYIPWTLRWLWYFEDWLQSDDWAGSGEHPDITRPRYGVRQRRNRSDATGYEN